MAILPFDALCTLRSNIMEGNYKVAYQQLAKGSPLAGFDVNNHQVIAGYVNGLICSWNYRNNASWTQDHKDVSIDSIHYIDSVSCVVLGKHPVRSTYSPYIGKLENRTLHRMGCPDMVCGKVCAISRRIFWLSHQGGMVEADPVNKTTKPLLKYQINDISIERDLSDSQYFQTGDSITPRGGSIQEEQPAVNMDHYQITGQGNHIVSYAGSCLCICDINSSQESRLNTGARISKIAFQDDCLFCILDNLNVVQIRLGRNQIDQSFDVSSYFTGLECVDFMEICNNKIWLGMSTGEIGYYDLTNSNYVKITSHLHQLQYFLLDRITQTLAAISSIDQQSLIQFINCSNGEILSTRNTELLRRATWKNGVLVGATANQLYVRDYDVICKGEHLSEYNDPQQCVIS